MITDEQLLQMLEKENCGAEFTALALKYKSLYRGDFESFAEIIEYKMPAQFGSSSFLTPISTNSIVDSIGICEKDYNGDVLTSQGYDFESGSKRY